MINQFQTGVDLQAMLDMQPELIQHYYDSYGLPQYAPVAIKAIEMAKTMPDETAMMGGIKKVLQAHKVLPPDDKAKTVENMKAMGVKHKDAVQYANQIKPLNKRSLAQLRTKLREHASYDKARELLEMVDKLNG